jgi:sterol desaturase/sphingolipid hydroxylase (fatty acid hydroxylase superfamily)
MNFPAGFAYLLDRIDSVFFSVSSIFSLSSLACALCVALVFLAAKRVQRNRRVRVKALARALFPRRITGSRSHTLDIGYAFFNLTVFAMIFGWAVLSYQVMTNVVLDGLNGTFGAMRPSSLPEFVSRSIVTVTLFLAYEFGYWLNHYLSHRVPFLWEFHKVHHSAEVLTPLTNFRVHPVDSLVFGNIVAITVAIANGAANYLLGETAYQYAITDRNVLFVVFIHALLHLQHTHLWISFRGVLGRIVLSPAHHQIHHSNNPVHFDKNLGGSLAIWDWLFGTLHVPNKERERLTFGVDDPHPAHHDHHTLTGSLLHPLWRVALLAARAIGGKRRHAAPQPAPNSVI